MGVHWAKEIYEEMPEVEAAILDLRSLLPWDKEAVREVVRKDQSGSDSCMKTLLTGGIGAEISAWINEHCFNYLDAPVIRVGVSGYPHPVCTQAWSKIFFQKTA